MQNARASSPFTAGPVPRPWRVAMLPACVAAVVAAGFAVVSLAVGWRQIGDPSVCPQSYSRCGAHPVVEQAGVIGVVVLAAVTIYVLFSAAAAGASREGSRWQVVAAVGFLVALAVTVAVTTRAWTSDQVLPGFGGLAALVSTVAAAAGGVLGLWALVAWRGVRRVTFVLGVAVAVIAAGVTATAATAGWGGLSVNATMTAAVPAPAGQVAAAPSRLLWSAMTSSPGDGLTVAGGLVIVPAESGDRDGVTAVDPATGQIRWQYLRADQDTPPSVVMSPQAVGLLWVGAPAVYLDARTGRPEAVTHTSRVVRSFAPVDQVMLGTTYVAAQELARSHAEIWAVSAVTGRDLWTDRISDCPFFLPGSGVAETEPGIAQAGRVIAVLYGCEPGLGKPGGTLHLALFGSGGSRRDVTAGTFTSTQNSLCCDTGMVTAGDTVLVQNGSQQTAVSASSGAVLWRKHAALVAQAGDGQVVLVSSPSVCGRYAAATGRQLAAYPASSCAVLRTIAGPEHVTGGRLYVAGGGGGPLKLRLTVIDVSGGAVLAAPVIRLPVSSAPGLTGLASGDVIPGDVHADGNILVLAGDTSVLAVR